MSHSFEEHHIEKCPRFWGDVSLKVGSPNYCISNFHQKRKISYIHTTSGFPMKMPRCHYEDAIMIARGQIASLDDVSLEGDIPEDVSDIVEVREKALFMGTKFCKLTMEYNTSKHGN
jgi:hypothetical protein